MNFELAQIARAVAGRLHPAAARGRVGGVSTDSRTLQPGQLFVALRGPNFDGHAFLATAAEMGAAACLCERPQPELSVPQIEVADTLQALGALAHAWRHQFELPVLAVTGSSGKTTTKEMLAAILAETGSGLKSSGNFNNLIGLPLTLFGLDTQHRWAVLELGMSARGEIARLAEIAAPQIGVITNVGPAHLATLHGLDGVARAKGELFAALPVGGTAVINADDERVAQLPVANGARRLFYGVSTTAEVRAETIAVERDRVRFALLLPDGRHEVLLSVAGRHNVSNALAAAAAALAAGVDGASIASGLAAFRPIPGRMESVSLAGGGVMLEDSYNANPLSMKAALLALDELGGSGRRIAVLGDMLELGPEAEQLHREVGREAARRADLLIALGGHAADLAEGARDGGLPARQVKVAASHEEALELLRRELAPGDRVLVKGSRGMRMERISAALRQADGPLGSGH